MIGLGSNRMSVCRRGGMSVTQAGRGGMEWLAGGRMPSWASPYSAQATAALLAQFPTQWPTIRDYGFSHPEIVPIVNTYAPTFPDIVRFIGMQEIGGINLPHTGLYGQGAVIQTNIVVSAEDEIEIVFHAYGASSVEANVFGGGNRSFGNGWTGIQKRDMGGLWAWFGGSRLDIDDNLGAQFIYTKLNKSKIEVYAGGELIKEEAITPSIYTDNAIALFGVNRKELSTYITQYAFKDSICSVLIKRNGVYTHVLTPKQVGTSCGFYNHVDGFMLYKTGGSGSFTISETPAS